MAWNLGSEVKGEAAAPRKYLGGNFISRPSRYLPSSRIRRRIQSIWTESRSTMSIRPRGPGASFMLSPDRQRIFRTPNAAAPTISACKPMRVRSRAATCMTGSTPFWRAMDEHAQEDIRGVAEGQSVKLTAVTKGLTRLTLLHSLFVETVIGGWTSAVTTNSPDRRRFSKLETGSESLGAWYSASPCH